MTNPYAGVSPKLMASSLGAMLAADGVAIEAILRDVVVSDCNTVNRVGSDLVSAGGKRLRPMLVVLAARACECEPGDAVYQAAAATELIHMATLIHDDVVDRAATRRGLPTAFSLFGETASVLSGDVLLAKAMHLLARAGDIEVIRIISSAVVAMAEGEVREVETRGSFYVEEAAHLEILRLKTAEFMAACCQSGAILAGATKAQQRALSNYGLHLGMAFQIVDDVLDYSGDPEVTGKPQGTDFIEGCATLPLIRLRDRADEELRNMLESHFGAELSAEGLDVVVRRMLSDGALEEAKGVAQRHIADACESLSSLPENDATLFLEEITRLVLSRKS